MAVQISGTNVIDNARQFINSTGIVATSGAGIITATSYRGDGSQLTGISEFGAGTLMLFQQTTAPTGWTKQTTHNNKALRVVSGAASSGGTTAFTSVFTSRTPAGTNSGGSVGNTTLSQSQMPSHTHTITTVEAPTGDNQGTDNGVLRLSGVSPSTITSSSTGGSTAHNHGFTQPTWTGTAMDFAVQYVDLIIASKN